MEYLFSILLFGLNLLDYEIEINRIIFLGISIVLFGVMFFIIYKKSGDFLCACLCSMCHVWPMSWRNIFGDPTEALQLPWFYIIGVFIIIYALINYKKIYTASVNVFFISVLILSYIITLIPMLLSPSKTEGLKEYIMIVFYIVMISVAFLFPVSLSEKHRKIVLDAYVWCVFISCFFLILQTIMYNIFGIALFYRSEGIFGGNSTVTVGLLMGDLSSATIMLGSAVFICLSRIEKKENIAINILIILMISIGLALTSRRTSTVSLIIVLFIYALMRYKNSLKKVLMIVFLALISILILNVFQYSRPVDNILMYLYENGRFENYLVVFQLIATNFFGMGYDTVYTNGFMVNNVAPHNTVLRWMLFGGPLFAVIMAIIPLYSLYTAYKKKLNTEFWIILYSLFASNFIPDILTARFFVIPCMCVFLFQKNESPIPKMLKKNAYKK